MAGPVIITRAEPGNGETAARLHAAGLPYICAPMLVLGATGAGLPPLEDAQGLLFTSANGVRAFCAVSARRDLTAWCVGPATLAAARGAGFDRLEHGDGNGMDLAWLVAGKAQPGAGALVHVANEAAAGQLAQTLKQAGFTVVFAPLYGANPVSILSAGVKSALDAQPPCAVLVHSAKAAAAFAALTLQADLSRHILVAVSEAASGPLVEHGFGRTCIAARPNEDALMAALFKAYSTL